ncbi:hypothetical protein Anas_01022 [Armadillidium nasatum]|uniref:Uncharacterized protein n=1 Tax=Armadillidium nasatum TaxID=96803 RepID=A0A5N5T000_9CRUS|nr:hypothetical protein Anas_01022 [Armadillidium nasatum]
MSSSSCSSCTECNKQAAKDEWDLAEEEWLEKKKKSDILQKEIVHVVKNLKRTSISPEPEIKPSLVNRKEIHIPSDNLVRTRTNDRIDAEDLPKTFFFGMDPGDRVLEHGVEAPLKTNSALSKLNDQDEVKIIGSSVEYSRHSLKPKEKRRSLEREHWNRSLDYRESRSRNSKSKERDFDHSSRPEGKKRISKEVDEFAATIEREKIKQRPVDELSNSISRKGDGGYHSRQNSGSFNLGNEGSDEDNLIRMNLRPTLPRRQLELPRFSPNAAWRLLSVETSGKQKELQSEVTLSDDHFSISEDRIHRYTRPTAPPRASGEKSADSGISGDAGSPGPLQEFEPLPAQVKVTHGPLAASSPVASGRIDIKRAWTPAQDLDDNSFEEHNNEANGKGSLHYEVSTMPKLTSRSNMFCKQSLHSSRTVEEERYNEFPIEIEPPHPFSDNLPSPVKYRNEDYQMDARSLQRSKKASPPHRTSNLTKDLQEASPDDDWRENWSMSRSIPNSLNAFDERDCVDGTSAPCRSKSESRVSLSQLSDNKSQGLASKTTIPGYMNRGNSGHIMYLPEYKAYQLSKENLNQSDNGEIIDISTPEQEERKSPSGDENPTDPESLQWNIERQAIGDPEQLSKGKRFIVLNGKKNKKFSYQSTVRMMEKKKLEDKLSKEVEEKEKRRIQEMEAMMKVEQEFQEKREREKKRLKQQLQFFQEQQQQDHKHLPHQPQQKESNAVNNDIDHPHRTLSPTPSSPSPAPPFAGHRSSSSYQSLPMELVNSNGYPGSSHQGNQSGLLSGFKNWVKGKKDPKLGRESRSGYLSDASSVTAHSSSRQEPDGAPASSPTGRKNLDSIRAEIIAGSRHRNGNTILERETSTPSSGTGRYRGDSPVPSILSKESHRRTMTPDSRRPVSPESRKSAASEASPATHNYRRDFCLGNLSNTRTVHHQEDMALYSRHSNESRKSSKHNKKNYPMDPDGRGPPMMTHSLRRQYPPSKGVPVRHSVPMPIPPHHGHRNGFRVIRISTPHAAPYNPNRGYRP